MAEGKFRINPSMGPPMLCGFEEGKAEEVHEAMRKSVKVRVDPKTKRIDSIEIPKDPPAFGGSFFEAKTIDQLIAEQGTESVADPLSMSGVIPDEYIDEMLEAIYSSRTA